MPSWFGIVAGTWPLALRSVACRRSYLATTERPGAFLLKPSGFWQDSSRAVWLRRLRHLHRRSDSYRTERPVIRAGIAPAENRSLFTAQHYRNPKKHCYTGGWSE
jgi:hypothetical protein